MLPKRECSKYQNTRNQDRNLVWIAPTGGRGLATQLSVFRMMKQIYAPIINRGRQSCLTYFHVKLNRINPLVPKPAPIQSTLPSRSRGDSAGRSHHRIANMQTAITPLYKTQHIERTMSRGLTHMKTNKYLQGVNCVKTPARTAPTYPPIGAAAPKIPKQKFRIFPGGKVMPIMATALGRMRAPPRPVKPRARLNTKKSEQKLLISDHKANQAPPRSNMFLWP